MRYRILGVTQTADDHGTPVPVPGSRLRTLLTALALRPGRLTAPDVLIDEVWADAPPQDAPAALQALVGRLRRTVGKDTVTSGPGGYRLAATEDDVDLFVFEKLVHRGTTALRHGDPAAAVHALDTALALWRGPALADLPDRTAAARPEALHRDAVRARAEADLLLGRAHEAVPRLSELTAAHPYDEPLHALLIRALRDTGRAADALAAYETARRTLADGLGTDPGPELRALYAELLDGEADGGRSAGTEPAGGRAPDSAPAHRTAALTPPPPPERNGNLRPRLTSFVGREPELDAIRSTLHRARLVTLTGPGGSGKTRLAEEAAAGLPQAWLVELAPLDRPEAVPGAVVSALGLRETVLLASDLAVPQDDPVALLVEYCAPRSELLILDNCEHVIGAAAALAETLLTRCPGLTILATSREPLGVPGEQVRPVEPLLPDQAHRLFRDRAAAVRPDAAAALRERDEQAVAEICRRLDGLPLAIELAAARLRLLTPRQIADRLDDRFRLLTSGSRTVLPRQQTLRAVVDWSWDLLDAPERTLLRELSVFAGGWDLDAAEAVCTGPVADLVGALVDKSLVVATPAPPGPDGTEGMRYRMLETIHEYATERAAEIPHARVAAERRHRAWVRALTERADSELRTAEQLPWIARLETELDNIRAATRRALTSGDEEEATALCLAMGWFWWLRNYRHEGAEWTDSTLRLAAVLDTLTDGSGTVPDDLDALAAAVDPLEVFLAEPAGERDHPRHSGRMDLRMLHLFLLSESRPGMRTDGRYRQYLLRLLARYERGGPESARMPGLIWPVTAFQLRDGVDPPAPFDPREPTDARVSTGGVTDVRVLMDEAVANCRRYGGEWELGCALMFRAHTVVDSPGRLRGVDDDLAELREIARRVGDRWMRAQVCGASGEAAMARGRFAEAEQEYREGLRLAYEVGAYTETPFLMTRLAEIAYRSGDLDAARVALDEAQIAADRHSALDAQAFVSLLRAHIALTDGDVAGARELCEAARAETGRGSPPPQFMAALRMLDAQILAAESGPAYGLPLLADALRRALADQCSEAIMSAVVDSAVELLARLGDFPRAAGLLAAADVLLGPFPRPAPQAARTAKAEAAARTALGAERYAAERARGKALPVAEVVRELTAAVHAHAVPARR
ncbi:BTAD domain-containing putative transcriptional regulator [Streptomyces sp. Amel2xC10]|uniref:AfsR/SARP family transcriptional regulator n=1 Tax=Streptomyces sp. Amel2xC10 TaxID=1305826 RepID=UPI000A081E6F|nr:BTAD domain-containing putative transcriptional regulator [Streptomyces sp. Amel2xC10]SMF85812.1 Predicted ATPase [Streptomyces sp. Amel2xC10]